MDDFYLEDKVFGHIGIVGYDGTEEEGKECLKNFYKAMQKYIVPYLSYKEYILKKYEKKKECFIQSDFLWHMNNLLRIKMYLRKGVYTGACTVIDDCIMLQDLYNPEVYNTLSRLLLEYI